MLILTIRKIETLLNRGRGEGFYSSGDGDEAWIEGE
jgi:hypothetical protein